MLAHATGLIAEVAQFVTGLITLQVGEVRSFHGLTHTQRVVDNCSRLASLECVNENDMELLLTAAWFHDTGYVKGSKDHEHESCRIARQFLESHNVNDEFISRVEKLIMATRMPTSPCDMLQEIICDADMSHLGSPEYWRWQLKLKQELEFAEGFWISDQDWARKNVGFFKNHHYYSAQAQRLWDEQKRTNLRILENLSDDAM